MGYDVLSVRRQFPFFGAQKIAYLDSGATSQKPQIVIDAVTGALSQASNVSRGVYPLAEVTTAAYDGARRAVAEFINASPHEIVFVKSATEGINLVARTFGSTLTSGDRIALSVMEHHANIVPWQQLSSQGIAIDWVGIDTDGQPNMSELETILKRGKTRMIAMTGLSNVLGSMPDCADIARLAHEYGAKLLIDASQLVAHAMIDVRKIDCDFLVFSGHKLYGPTGIGALYGKTEILESLPPFLGGGDMIQAVTEEGFSAAESPRKFEAGTPPIAEAIGLATAVEWMHSVGPDAIFAYEDSMIEHALTSLAGCDGLTILGPRSSQKRKGCISFTVNGVHPHDLAEVLGRNGICIRAGHHCCQPLHRRLGIQASARMSIAAYTTKDEIDQLVEAIKKAQKLLTK